MQHREARQVDRVATHRRRAVDGRELETELARDIIDVRARAANDPAASRECRVGGSERGVRRFDGVPAQQHARRGQRRLAGIAQQERSAGAANAARHRSGCCQRLAHGDVEYLRVVDSRCRDTIEERPRPADIVVRRVRLIGREILLVEELDRGVAEG
jgi:hypothetical protein